MTYAHPEVLVSTEWLAEHGKDPNVRIIEVDVDTAAYEQGHVEGSVAWNWQTQLSDTVRRDIIPKSDLENLLGKSGIDNNTTLILYGDNNNWFACWAFWQLKTFGFENVKIMDGGRKKWVAEKRPLTTSASTPAPKTYKAKDADLSRRAFLDDVRRSLGRDSGKLVDVRSPDEFSGKILSPPGLPETCQRGGHIPGAQNVPWGKNCNEDGTFKSAQDLKAIYEPLGITQDKDVVAYCRIGERSSLTWFALNYLLGYKNVKNYDGSWTEWGNLVNAPVARGDQPG